MIGIIVNQRRPIWRKSAFSFYTLVLSLFLFLQQVESKVLAPNYNFSFDIFSKILPQTTLVDVEKNLGKAVQISKSPLINRYLLRHGPYSFPVFVQFSAENRVNDFYAKLPSYFLHDTFHQAIINRHGKQNTYYKQETNALYIWNDVGGNKIYYSGSCSITCFPIYYSVILKESQLPAILTTLTQQKLQ